MIEQGIAIDAKEPDGKSIVVPSPAGLGMRTWLVGRGDQFGPLKRGLGGKLYLSFAAGNGEVLSKTIQFGEPVEIHDGQGMWRPVANWDLDDELEVKVDIAASVVSSTPDAGNCNLTDVGGYNLLTPAAGDGSHTVALASDASPIIVDDENEPDGYWSVDKQTGIITAAAVPGEGNCNLIDVAKAGYMMRGVPIGHEAARLDIDVYKTEWIHQTHTVTIKVTKNSAGAGKFAAWLLAFRKNVSES